MGEIAFLFFFETRRPNQKKKKMEKGMYLLSRYIYNRDRRGNKIYVYIMKIMIIIIINKNKNKKK